MGADTLGGDLGLQPAPMPPADIAVGGLCYNHEFWAQAPLLDHIIPAQPIAVFLLHGGRHYQGIVILQSQPFDQPPGIDHGCHAAFLIGSPPAPDGLIVLITFEGIEFPLPGITHIHGVHMAVDGNQVLSAADGA